MTFVRDRFADMLAHRVVPDDVENNLVLGAMVDGLADSFGKLGLIAFGGDLQEAFGEPVDGGSFGPLPAFGDDESVDGGSFSLGGGGPIDGGLFFADSTAGADGSRILRDPSVAPLWALAHAALYTGAQLPGRLVGEQEGDYIVRARSAAVYPLGLKRGTHEAVLRAIQPLLTGNRAVLVADDTGDPNVIFVRTLASETPNPSAVRLALEGDFVSGGARGAIRAEQSLVYVTADGVAWAEATLGWAAVPATTTWDNATLEDLT